MDEVIQDLRYAFRTLGRSPVFAVATLSSLLLAIGASTAVFSVIDAVLLRPLPYADPHRVVLVDEYLPDALDDAFDNVAPANYVDLHRHTGAFRDLAARSPSTLALVLEGEAQQVTGGAVTVNTFELLGARPERGRGFAATDADPASPRVILLSHQIWKQRFGGSPAIVGRVVDLDTGPATVVGVMPASFRFPGAVDEFWLPIQWTDANYRQRSNHFLTCVGRLADGVGIATAQAAVRTLAKALERAYPETNAGVTFHVRRLDDALTSGIRPALGALFATASLMFLIACVNVTNLTLTRTIARRGELAVRFAVGARRWRIIRQLSIEASVLAALGGAMAAIAYRSVASGLLALMPAELVTAGAGDADWRVAAFIVGATVVAALTCAVTSAIVVMRGDGWNTIIQSTRTAGGTRRERFVRQAFVTCEVTLAITLLVSAGLLLRSFVNVARTAVGFRTDHVLTAQFALPSRAYAGQAARLAFVRRTLEGVALLPGVQAAGFITCLPLTPCGLSSWFTRQNMPSPHPEGIIAVNRLLTPGYFRALGVPLRGGRWLDERDVEGRPLVAVVNEAAAGRFWPGELPVGRRFKFGPPESDKPWIEIVGVVGDIRQKSPESDVQPEIDRPIAQDDQQWLAPRALVIRTAMDPTTIAAGVRESIRGVDSRVPVVSIQQYGAIVDDSIASRRVIMITVASFASLALVLAIIGVAGIVAYTVAGSRREIAVRLALGAQRRRIVGWMVGYTAPAVVAGVTLGLLSARIATRWVATLLFHVSATDPGTFLAVVGVVAGAAVLAAYVPARRAGSIDPAILLRDDV
jgi:putative ABC transport system permease protein